MTRHFRRLLLLLPLLLAAASCAPRRAAAAVSAAGSVRSDVWNHDLPESGVPDPTDGRRVHLVVDGLGADAAVATCKS